MTARNLARLTRCTELADDFIPTEEQVSVRSLEGLKPAVGWFAGRRRRLVGARRYEWFEARAQSFADNLVELRVSTHPLEAVRADVGETHPSGEIVHD